MSKIGKLPIILPSQVRVELSGQTIKVVGPRGSLEWQFPEGIFIEKKEDRIFLNVKSQDKKTSAFHGTARATIANMIRGVSEGWVRKLELVGTGYRAEVGADILTLAVGHSHPIKIKAPEGIVFKVEKSTISVEGADRQIVGQTAARIRALRPPEPYKGKGIKYQEEVVKRKAGKAAKAVGAPA